MSRYASRMSWNLKATGNKEVVKALVMSETQMPTLVKEHICGLVDGINEAPNYGRTYQPFVETFGHVDGGGGEYTVKIGRIQNGAVAPDDPK